MLATSLQPRFRFGFVGVDETIPVAELVTLSTQYDWLEWGVCLCYQGTPEEQMHHFSDSSVGGGEASEEVAAWWESLGPANDNSAISVGRHTKPMII